MREGPEVSGTDDRVNGKATYYGNTRAVGSFQEKIMNTVWDLLNVKSLCTCPEEPSRNQLKYKNLNPDMEFENGIWQQSTAALVEVIRLLNQRKVYTLRMAAAEEGGGSCRGTRK